MSLTLTFKLEMHSDYHVGAGHGRGTEIDSALLRDADGVPVLRGTVLNGLLRDGLWRLLQLGPLEDRRACPASGKDPGEGSGEYCGQYTQPDHDPELCPICRLFGSPRHRKRWRISSARPVDHQDIVSTAYQPADLPEQWVTRVRVNPRTRRAAARQLFSEEQGGKQTFIFTATCPTDGDDVLDDAALLVAAARFVRELGRSRRRGQGECLISLIDVQGADLGDRPQATLLTRFETQWLRGDPAPLTSRPGEALAAVAALEQAEDHPFRLRVLIRLEEPLIIAMRAAAGNRFQSRDAIPGTVLRGALANRAAQAFDLDDDATYDAFLHLFLRDGVRFSTLYPLQQIKDAFYSAIPTPRDGFTCKVYPEHDIEWGTKGSVRDCSQCDSPTKAVRGTFYALRELSPEPFEPKKRVEMHIRVDPKTGRVAEGQLFDYMPLEAGQYFVGELRCTNEETWHLLKTFTGLKQAAPFDLRVGRARRRGYGKITLWLDDEHPLLWSLLPLADRVPENAQDLTLTLLTDAIIQDDWGRFATGFDAKWLQDELSLPVNVVKGRDFASQRATDGYNAQWRLPRWRVVTLQAGSTVRLQLKGPVTPEVQAQLQQLEREGIGERRNEGYGWIVFNHPLYKSFAGVQSTRMNIPKRMEFASRESETFGERYREWQDRLDAFVEEHKRQWRRLEGEGQPVTALARWLMRNRYRDVPALIAEVTKVGTANEDLKSLIRAQGQREGEDEYGDRPQKNRLTEKKVIWLAKKLLQELNEQPSMFWPKGIQMIADQLATVAEMNKEA